MFVCKNLVIYEATVVITMLLFSNCNFQYPNCIIIRGSIYKTILNVSLECRFGLQFQVSEVYRFTMSNFTSFVFTLILLFVISYTVFQILVHNTKLLGLFQFGC